jgi:hypothetical protein
VIFNLPGGVQCQLEVGGMKGSGMRHTSDQVRVLAEDLCGRDVYVDHLLSESLEHVTMRYY